MTYYEAAQRIHEHNMIHSRKEPNAVYITEALRMAIFALNRQEPRKPVHIHEEYPEHLWKRNSDVTIDTSAMDSGFHNGPYCTRCHHSECEHCNPNWETKPEEPCVVDKDVCPACGKDLDYWHKGNYCRECGQALDWSEIK